MCLCRAAKQLCQGLYLKIYLVLSGLNRAANRCTRDHLLLACPENPQIQGCLHKPLDVSAHRHHAVWKECQKGQDARCAVRIKHTLFWDARLCHSYKQALFFRLVLIFLCKLNIFNAADKLVLFSLVKTHDCACRARNGVVLLAAANLH